MFYTYLILIILLGGCSATCVCDSQHMQVGRLATMARGDLDEFLASCADACRR